MAMAQNWRQIVDGVKLCPSWNSGPKQVQFKKTFKSEQLAAHKQSSEQTRQIFSKKLHGLTKKKKKKRTYITLHCHTFRHQF